MILPLDQLVPTRETCEKLRDAGFPQETYFNFSREKMYNDSQFRLLAGLGKSYDWVSIAAPTAAEILEVLPLGPMNDDGDRWSQVCWPDRHRVWWHDYGCPDVACEGHATYAEALALLWLKTKEAPDA